MNVEIEDKISFEEIAQSYPKLSSLAEKYSYLRGDATIKGERQGKNSAYCFHECFTLFRDSILEWWVLSRPLCLHIEDINSGDKGCGVFLMLATLYWIKKQKERPETIEFWEIGTEGWEFLARFLGFGNTKALKEFFKKSGGCFSILSNSSMPFGLFEKRVNGEWSKKE